MIELGVFEWFEENAEAHFAKHGVRFETLIDFEMETALVTDHLRDGQMRFKALGLIKGRLHAFVFFRTAQGRLRAISLRKANAREARSYETHRPGRR